MIKGKTTMEEVLEGSSSKIKSMIDASELMVMGGKPEEEMILQEIEANLRKLKCQFLLELILIHGYLGLRVFPDTQTY